MSPKQKQRMAFVALLLLGIGASVTLALVAFEQNLQHFYSPSQITQGEAPSERTIRVGGLVTANSVKRATEGLKVHFTVTDTAAEVPVEYEGILPDLFREGQGIVAIGKMQGKTFVASEVLAKHDENYMPPEVADSLNMAEKARQAAQTIQN